MLYCFESQNFDDNGDSGSKTTYDVAIFASDSWRKVIPLLSVQIFLNPV